MSLFIASLNSGSNGNCYYVGNDNEAVLIDAGISCRETEKRMKRIGLSIDKVKAIFISHEHGDHISGVAVLAKKYSLPVYITAQTFKHGRILMKQQDTFSFTAHQPIHIGNLQVTAFPKFHDASDPHSFMVSCGSVNVGVFTDLGICCEQLTSHFKQCHAAFLEANYDVEMLANGSYPYHLKKRISGGEGHLSNAEALKLFVEHRPSYMSHLLLAHLSKNNNDPQLVEKLFNSHTTHTKIIVATRYNETEVFHITHNGSPAEFVPNGFIPKITLAKLAPKKIIVKKNENQLTLF